MEIKNTLRTFEAQNGENFKNIEPRPKITGSYKKERVYWPFPGILGFPGKFRCLENTPYLQKYWSNNYLGICIRGRQRNVCLNFSNTCRNLFMAL